MMKLDCKQTEKLMAPFIRDTIDNRTKRAFLSHVEHCSSCMEELSIQFLVTTGLQRLESGDTFDLNRELRGRLMMERRHMKILDSLQGGLYVTEGLAVLFSVLILLIVVM